MSNFFSAFLSSPPFFLEANASLNLFVHKNLQYFKGAFGSFLKEVQKSI
jgi:hypothetical protein